MTDNRKSGIALIAGSVGGLLVMAMHPSASAALPAEQVQRLMSLSGAVHSIALVSFLVLFLGACGLAQQLARADRLSSVALITFGFACVGVMVAASISGFVVPNIFKLMAHDVPAAARQWQIVIAGIFQINQAFALIYSMGISLAIILWSFAALRNGGLGRGVAAYGCLMAAVIILGIIVGRLRFDVRGMSAIWFGQAIWFIVVGSQLYRQSPRVDPKISA